MSESNLEEEDCFQRRPKSLFRDLHKNSSLTLTDSELDENRDRVPLLPAKHPQVKDLLRRMTFKEGAELSKPPSLNSLDNTSIQAREIKLPIFHRSSTVIRSPMQPLPMPTF